MRSNSRSGEGPDERTAVLFFISSLTGGGAERVMVDILRFIDRRKFKPTLLLLCPYEQSPYRAHLPEDIPIIVVGRKSDGVVEKIRQFLSFLKVISRENPEVILSKLTHNNIMAILAGIFFNIEVVVCEHNTLSEVVKERGAKYILGVPVSPMVKVLYRYAGRIVAICEGIKKNLIAEFAIPEDRISVIYNPVDLNRITESSKESPGHHFFDGSAPVVVAAGRMVPQKGFDLLIKAFSRVVSEVEARLIIMGEGPGRESLEQSVRDLGISEKVFFAGFQHNPYKFMSHADVFVLSSRYEGLPMVVLESMVCGAPVIATDCRSGLREILNDGECGILVPPENTTSLAEAMIRLLKDKPLREKLSSSGRRRAHDFSAENIIRNYENVISQILKKP